MCYKCEITGLELDDSSAGEMFYCDILNEKTICVNCSNSKYEGFVAGHQILTVHPSQEYVLKIEKIIEKSFNQYLPIIYPDDIYCAMRHLPDAGGKRLRPLALLLSAQAVGGKPEFLLPAAIALEMIHNFTLIHDDIMDEAEIRRGIQTVHKKWGVPKAIIAGDALFSKAIEVLSLSNSEPSQIVESIKLLSHSIVEICEGQWMDMDFQERKDVTEEEYLQMVEKKTAVLFAAALKIGAILSGANEKISNALWDFGRLAGMGFQIYDDVIDLVTPEEILGKIQGGDIIEGKKTLIIINAYSNGVHLNILGKNKATRNELSEAIKILRESGSIDYAMNKAIDLVEQGKTALDILPDSEAKNILIGLADHMIERRY